MRRNTGRKESLGFTLAEVLLTVAIIVVTLGLGTVTYQQWLLNARFAQNNTTAETMFSVLQTELSSRRSGNTLSEVEKAFTSGDRAISGTLDSYLDSIITPSGNKPDYTTIYSGYALEPTVNTGPARGPIYYVVGTKQDLANYKQDPATVKQPLRMVYDMLSAYMFEGDWDLIDGCIAVELDPKEGLLYSVFFSKQADSLSYESNLLDRRLESRRANKQDLVGYCGVETLSISTSMVTSRQTIENLMLVNSETLNLTFNLNPTMATYPMSYNVSLFDASNNQKRVTIEFNNVSIGSGNYNTNLSGNNTGLLDCRVTYFTPDGMKSEPVMMTFPVSVDENGKIKLVLDAVDYHSAGLTDEYAKYVQNNNHAQNMCTELSNTFSIYRLGIEDVDDMYCKVYAEGGGFATTATKTSNTENRAFANSDTKNGSFSIVNARHLYNMRFEEAAGRHNSYTLANTVDVSRIENYSNYTVNGDRVIVGRDGVETAYTTFPSIEKLNEGSSLSGNGIRNLKITKEDNISWLKFGKNNGGNGNGNGNNENGNKTIDLDEAGTGLFLINNGTIKDVTLTDAVVDGTIPETSVHKGYMSDNTGAFCGTNAGTLSNLYTKGASTVTGADHVGGIFGSLSVSQSDKEITVSDLHNEADVEGDRFVGGITGLISSHNGTNKNITVKNCTNTGSVHGKEAYIGGIVGLSNSATLENCTSNPMGKQEQDRTGIFVGGIAGFANDSSITNCSTKLLSGTQTGYLVGDRYVGGIVGMMVNSTLENSGANVEKINQLNVIGNDFVGGIVGANADAYVLNEEAEPGSSEYTVDTSKQNTLASFIQTEGNANSPWYTSLDPKNVSVSNKTVSSSLAGWTNKGVVIAERHYGGGIVGFNTGSVLDCVSAENRSVANDGTGDYNGGVIGYNNGILKSATGKKYSVECNVSGRNFVGGVVGYNDVNAVLHDYKVTGGTIKGKGDGVFVGGYAGFNASIDLLENSNQIEANLNAIDAPNAIAVGGIIGGNIVPVADGKEIHANFNVNNFLGSIKGRYCVGGFIGYNALMKETDAVTLRALVSSAVKEIETPKENEVDGIQYLEEINEGKTSTATLIIAPKKGTVSAAYSKAVTGEVAVGGILGYSDKDTSLNITGIINKVPVTATGTMSAEQLSDLIGQPYSLVKGGEETYSLAGGIIGLVSENSTIENCRNQDIGSVKGNGTYLGGLAEISMGTIKDCQIGAIGDSTKSSVGGLVGINFGSISGTVANNATVIGRNYVGGICAENYGTIQLGVSLEGLKIQSYGDYAGGVCGFNGTTGKYTGKIQLPAEGYRADILSNGTYVGGLVGQNNNGLISGNCTLSGSVTGGNMVGGFIGHSVNGNIENLTNNASVTATDPNGSTAGIVAQNGVPGQGAGKIQKCKNTGTIFANAGNAAGITVRNEGEISECTNNGSINGAGGNAGGICVTNEGNGSVHDCTVTGTVEGLLNVGGVTAENSAALSANKVNDVRVSNLAKSNSLSNVGGIAGVNYNLLDLNQTTFKGVVVNTEANGSNIGGVVGTNAVDAHANKNGVVKNGDVSGSTLISNDQDIQPLDYVQTQQGLDNKNGSYFDLDYVPNINTKVVFDGYVVSGDTALVGVRKGAGDSQFVIQYDSTPAYLARIGTSRNELKGISANTPAEFTLSSGKLTAKVKDNDINLSVNTEQNNPTIIDKTLYAGAINTNGTVGNIGVVRINSIKIYERDVLKRYYRPAMTKAGEIGLLDYVNGKFYPYKSTDITKYGITADLPEDTVIKNITISTGNSVTFANIGNVAGLNSENAEISNITLKDMTVFDTANALVGGTDYGYGGIAGVNGGTIDNVRFSGTIRVSGSDAAIANVGGIAGRNTAAGTIKNSAIGLDSITRVEAENYGYVGGIAGYNFGTVESCDNRTDNEREENEVDASAYSVSILNVKGHTGGIVGNGGAGSLLKSSDEAKIATGHSWTVTSSSYVNDAGTGGIMGFSMSGNQNNNFSYIINNAEVQCTVGGNNTVSMGGMIGRFQNNENGNMIFDHCVNDGKISTNSSSSYSGGMIGRNKYKGVTFEHCENNGDVLGTVCGGIIGDNYRLTSMTYVYDCLNKGAISSNYNGMLGGLVGRDHDGFDYGVQIVDSINVGDVTCKGAGGTAGGIIGTVWRATILTRDRNYGLVKVGSADTYGAAGNISGTGLVVTDCFDYRVTNSRLVPDTYDKTKVVTSYYYAGTVDSTYETALNEWIIYKVEGLDTTQAQTNVQKKFNSIAKRDEKIVGLPTVLLNSKTQFSSYVVYDEDVANPVANIGIPNYTREDTFTYTSSQNFYDALEVQKTAINKTLSLMEAYYRDKYVAIENTAVLNLQLAQKGDLLEANWTAMPNAYAYKVMYEISDPDGSNKKYYLADPVYTNSCIISMTEGQWVGKKITVHVRAVDGTDEAWSSIKDCPQQITDTHNGKNTEFSNTNIWATKEIEVATYLPIPEVYLELGGMPNDGKNADATGKFIAVLKNTADYDSFLNGSTTPVVITSMINSVTFTIEYRYQEPFSAHSKNANVVMGTGSNLLDYNSTASYKGENGVSVSLPSTLQCRVHSSNDFENQTIVSGQFNRLSGIVPNELKYDLTLKKENTFSGLQYTEQVELVAIRNVDEDHIPLPVAVAGYAVHVAHEQAEYPVELSPLPEDLLETTSGFTVYSYPWYGQNEGFFTGHVVAKDLSVPELFALKDVYRNGADIFDSEGQPYPGYVVYEHENEFGEISYEVRYDTMLATKRYAKSVKKCTYSYDKSIATDAKKVRVDTQTSAGNAVVTPVNGMEPELSVQRRETNNESEYKFTWSVSNSQFSVVDAAYRVQLYGVDASSSSMTLLRQIDSTTNTEASFIDTDNTWNYGEIICRVTIIGSTDDKLWPYYSDCTLKQLQRFKTVASPVVAPPDDTGTMNYRLSWVQDREDVASDDFLCYEITIKDNATTDPMATTVLYAWAEGNVSAEKPSVKQDVSSVIVDLDAYQGRNVSISVRALADDTVEPEARKYRDGADGNATTLHIAQRLAAPSATMALSSVYTENKHVLRSVIENDGEMLTISGETNSYAVGSKYEIRVTLGGVELHDGTEQQISLGNSVEYKLQNEMINDNRETVRLSDHAGEDLNVSIRVVQDNSISSQWKEKTFTLPDMKLTAPKLSPSEKDNTLTVIRNASGQEDELSMTVKQKVISFADDTTNGGYEIHILEERDGELIPHILHLKRDNGVLVLAGETEEEDKALGDADFGYAKTLSVSNTLGDFETTLRTVITESEGNVTIMLPDYELTDDHFKKQEVFEESGEWTKSVSVTALKQNDHYLDSDAAYMDGAKCTSKDLSNFPLVKSVTGTTESQKKKIEVTAENTAYENYDALMEVTYNKTNSVLRTLAYAEGKYTLDLESMPVDWETISKVRILLIEKETYLFDQWYSFTFDPQISAPVSEADATALFAIDSMDYSDPTQEESLREPGKMDEEKKSDPAEEKKEEAVATSENEEDGVGGDAGQSEDDEKDSQVEDESEEKHDDPSES